MSELVQLSSNDFQMYSMIAKQKNTLVKLYASNSKRNIRVKYFPLDGWSQDKIQFYIHSLINIIYGLNRKHQSKFTDQFRIGMPERKFIAVQSPFIEANNLEKLFINQDKLKFQQAQYFQNFMHKLPFHLLDCFLACLDCNTIILNESNIYLQPSELIVNVVSFVGVDLVVFQEDMPASKFRSIYNFLDSQVLERKPFERLGHKQKIKNFAAMLLTFIMKGPLRLLENQVIPEIVTFSIAKELLENSTKLYEKYLKIKYVKKRVEQWSKNWNINLHTFFNRILVQEVDMSWGEIKSFISSSCQLDNSMQRLLHDSANEIWKKLQDPLKKYFISRRIVSTDGSKSKLDGNNQLFVIVMMGEKLGTLKEGSLIQELADHGGFDMKSMRIMTQFTNLVNFILDMKNQVNNAQSGETHVALYERIYHDFQLAEWTNQIDIYCRQEKDTCNNDSSQELSDFEDQDGTDVTIDYLTLQAEHQSIQIEGTISKEKRLKELCRLTQDKLTHTFQAQSKIVKIEHQRLKCLNAYEQAFR